MRVVEEAQHEIVFVGEFPPYLQEEIRFEADLVVSIFSERFGATPPETTITFARTREQLADAYRALTGRALPTWRWCFADRLPSARYIIFIHIGSCGFGYTVGDAAGFVLAHEYFHVLQLALAPDPKGPYWLSEGSAEYAMALFGDRRKVLEYEAFRNLARLRNASWTGTLEDAAGDTSFPPGHEHYFLGFLAVELLVELAGEDALLEYFRLLPAHVDWREAFEAAFGRTADEFYAEFEPHRAEAIAGYRTIRGRVIGSDEAPRDGVTLWALDEFDLKGGYGETAPDGTFSIGLTRDGSYRVEVYVVDATGLCNLAGWYAEGAGFTPSAGEAAYLLVEDGQVTVPDIRLPAEATPRPFAGRCVQ